MGEPLRAWVDEGPDGLSGVRTVAPSHALWHAIEQQLAGDRRACARELVQFLLDERPALRLLDRALRAASGTRLPADFAVANAMRCYARVDVSGQEGGVLACALRPNEVRAIGRLRGALPGAAWSDVTFDLGRGLARGLAGAPVRALPRLAAIARRLWRGHEPAAALRAVELIAYYARFSELLASGRYRVAAMSTYTNPWGLALHAAARRHGIPVVLAAHGMPVWPVARLDYDLAIVDSAASRDMFIRAGCQLDRVVLESARAAHRPLPRALPDRPLVIGVLLSKEPGPAVVPWLDGLLARPDIGQLVVRPHPASVWRGLERALARYPRDRVVLGTGRSCAEDLARVDFAIAGNSSVHVEALVRGTPAIFVPELDATTDDSYGLIASGLVVVQRSPAHVRFERVLRAYDQPRWRRVLARYANLDDTAADVTARLRAEFASLGVA
ncbi:MAG TPA: hypothetical protein VFQ53_02035 [Kofleriaceae bacterium]|nr:hypothetical protein [Kofleriaceae bacterium]